MDALDSLLAGSKPNVNFIGPDQLGTIAPPTRANPQGEQPDALDALLAAPKPAPEPGLGLGDTLGNIASSIGYGVTNLPNLGADVIEKAAPLAPNAPVTNADIARDEFHKRAQAATASDLANPAFGLGVAAQIAHALHAAPAAVVAANQPAPIDYRNLNPNGPAGTALAAMETAARGVVKTPLDVTAGGLSLADLVGLDHPQDAIFAGEQNADQDAATRAAEAAHPITTAGTGIATNLATFAGMPEADLGTLTVKAEQFAAEHPGVLGKLTQYLARSVANTPRAAVAGGIPQGEDAAQQTLANGGTLPQAYGEAAANTGLGTLAFELPASLGGPAPARAVGGAAVQAAANYGQQAASHAIAPQVFPEAQVSPEAAGLGALFGLLGGHGEAPAVEAPRAAEPVPALDTIAAKMRAELKAQGLSDAQIDAILNPAPEGATPTLPAPVVHVDTAGNAATQAQADAARRAAETLGLTPDVLKAQAARAGSSAPEPAPREPLGLPAPVVQVDRAGTARTSADFMRELAAAQQAARDRVAMGLTPDVERAQAARNAPALAAQEQERITPSPATIDDVLAEVEGRQHAPEGAPEPESGIPESAPEKVDAYFSHLPSEIGWEQRGGGIIRGPGSGLSEGDHAMAEDRSGPVIGRTPWVPKVGGDGQPSDFWRMRPDKSLTEPQAHEAFRKVSAGEPLRPIEQRFIDYARQSAHEYAQAEAEDTARFEAEQNEADDLERQRAIEELRNESARFATADHPEAFTVAQWARRAREAGMSLDETLAALGEGDNGTRISNLAKAIADKENTRGAVTQSDGLGSEGGIRESGQGQAAPVREGESAPPVEGQRPAAPGDLFPAATAREQVAAAERAKDEARNGNTGRVIPGFEGTDLGATPHGEAPEQARIPEDDTPDAPLDIRYGKRRIPAAIGSKPKPSDIPESSGIEVTEHTEGDVPPEIAELQGRHAARTDNAAMAEHLRQANVEQGEREARERGLRGAVGDTIGDHRVTFVHDEEGLPPEVKARLRPLKNGNVRRGLFDPKTGDTWIFTKRVHTPEQAAWTAAHEIAGHKGFRALVSDHAGVKVGGRTPTEALNSATDLALQNPTIAKLADAIGKQRGSGDRRLMAEEGIAELAAAARTGRWDEIAQRYGVDVPKVVREGLQGALRNFVARLRKILNAIHAKLTGKPETFSDEQVHQLLADSFAAAKQGGESADTGDVLEQRVFHGTPHTVDKFSLQKIGTGEGHQAYGWGIYFAGRKEIAEHYRDNVPDAPRIAAINKELSRLARIMDSDSAGYANFRSDVGREASEKYRQLMHERDDIRAAPGNLYHAEVPEDSDLLDWDKPLSEQPEKVREALRQAYEQRGFPMGENGEPAYFARNTTGESLYTNLASSAGAKGASELLNELGVPGLRYLDGSSRHRPLHEIAREFLSELSEDASIEDVQGMIGTGRFSPKNDALLKALAGDDWLGFDYPSQAISAALGKDLSNFEVSPELRRAVSDAQEGGTHNYVIWDENAIGEPSPLDSSGPAGRGTNATVATDKNVAGKQDPRAAGDESRRELDFRAEDRLARVRNVEEEYRLPNVGQVVPPEYVPPQAKQKFVTIYRGVPKHLKDATIRPGDWVSFDPEYAAMHGTGESGASRVISTRVPAQDVAWAGTDMNEWFYVPKEGEADSIAPGRSGASFRSNEPLASEEPQERAGEMGHGASGPAPAGATGVKNEQVKAERAARGLDEVRVAMRRSDPMVAAAAEAMLRDDPQLGLRLAAEIARKPRALTPEEQLVLGQDRARIFVDRHQAAEAVNAAVKAGDAKAEAIARDRLFHANQQLETSDVASRLSGYEQGLSLSVRRILSQLDYSREGMETRLQAAKGKPLDVEELNKLRDLHQKMQDVEAKMAGRTEAKEARQKETKAKLQEQLRLFKDQLNQAESRRDTVRQKQLRKQISELARRIVEGDYSKVQRTPIQYNEETRKLEAERNRLRGTFEEMAAKAERMNRGPVKKTLSMIHDLQMASILLSLHVYKKLAYAVGGGHAMSLLADATRSGARHVPGIKGIAEQSPQYGRGLDLAAMRARAQGIKEAPKEVVNQLRYGMATREAAHGMGRGFSDEYFTFAGTLADAIKTPGLHNKAAETTRALAGYVGRSHAAEKEFLAQPEFREGIVRQTQFLMRQMEKAGKSKEEIAQEMSSESTQAAIGAKALERAFESKMQGKNDFSRSVDAMIGTLDRSQNAGANFLGFMLKTIFPIRKVGVNVVVQGTSLMGGGLKALAAALKKGDMTPERADYIMKNIGQQGAGALLLALGAIYYNQFGGVPGVFSKKDQPKHRDELGNVIKPGEANGFGTEAFHGAPAAMIQVGASMAQVFEKEHGKRDGLDLALNVAARPTLAWLVRTTPYTDTIRRMTNTAEYGRGRKEGPLGAVGEISGQTARGILVPGVVQQAAAASDPYKGFRRPRNFGEDLKLGIPGLREQVPKERR